MAAWPMLALVLVGVLAWAAWPAGRTSDADRVRSLARQIRCPDCESLSAADSHTSSARAIRRDLAERVAAGESDARIRRAYADRYGSSILLDPQRSGLGIVLWGVPILVLVGGAGVLVVALRRDRSTRRHQVTAADEALVREARDQGSRSS